ncbi:MAG: cobyric acid synthase, partial [Desulfovibrio sp.]|nr:cobyric acid synthase [Desulfovibrio sp.]
LTRYGLRVAPFKAQNMALNSFVTPDGGEMGRAQALQAAACGLEADVRMNPVLLKPASHTGSQVIVLGEPVGQMHIDEYLRYKPEAWKIVRRAYRSLSMGMDAIILEGAGSPAEINLRQYDIVNMRMARYARAKVLLVADIDRGGAFAALVGTMSLLTRADRARVAGFLLNKFRGEASLLQTALEFVTRRTGKPFLGVIPMLEDLCLPEEDSVNFKAGLTPGLRQGRMEGDAISLDIVVPDLPHISNATDLDALRAEPGVRVRVIRRVTQWGTPDIVIVPGSRNTVEDLRWLRRTGIAESLVNFAKECLEKPYGMLVGICGGLQMLGCHIDDPLHLEAGGNEPALGLLPLHTDLKAAKRLCRTEGVADTALTATPTPLHVFGYEIHHGSTFPTDTCSVAFPQMPLRPLLQDTCGRSLGWGICDKLGRPRIWGTYLHGLFDADPFRHALLSCARREARLPDISGVPYNLGPELDRLADLVEQSLNMPDVFALLNREYPGNPHLP